MIHPVQEPDAVPGTKIAGVGLGVILAIVACALAGFWIESCRSRGLHALGQAAKGPYIPDDVSAMETRPFSVQAQGLEDNQRAERLLSTYSWVDRDRGIIRVPVEVAYQLVLQKQGGGGR